MLNRAATQSNLNRNERGASLVEFALVAPIFFLAVFTIFAVGRVLAVRMVLNTAAERALSLASVEPNLDTDCLLVPAALRTACGDRRKISVTRILNVARSLPLQTLVNEVPDQGSSYFISGNNITPAVELILAPRVGNNQGVRGYFATGNATNPSYSYSDHINPPSGEPLVAYLQRVPIEVRLRAEVDTFLPFFGRWTVEGSAVGYREPRFVSSFPPRLDCRGNPIPPGGVGAATCPCSTNQNDPTLIAHPNGAGCICVTVSSGPSLVQVVSQGLVVTCKCPNANQQYNPGLNKCVACPNNQVLQNGTCVCPTVPCQGGTVNTSCVCSCPQGQLNQDGLCCPAGQVNLNGQCSCPPAQEQACITSGGTVITGTCGCSCPAPFAFVGGICRCPGNTLRVGESCECPASVAENCNGGTVVSGSNGCSCECPFQQGLSNGLCCPWSQTNVNGICCNNGQTNVGGGCGCPDGVEGDCTGSGGNFNSGSCGCGCPAPLVRDGTRCRCTGNLVQDGAQCHCPDSVVNNCHGGTPTVGGNGNCTCSCPAGQRFSNGHCCPSLQAYIDGQCRCPSNQEGSCEGSGGNYNNSTCGCACPGQLTAVNSVCRCPGNLSQSGNSCTCPASVTSNCQGGTTNITNNVCSCTCPNGQTLQNGLCCPNGQVNQNGTCGCPAGQENACSTTGGDFNTGTCSCVCPGGMLQNGNGCRCPGNLVLQSGSCECPANFTCSGGNPINTGASCSCDCPPTATLVDRVCDCPYNQTIIDGACGCEAPLELSQAGTCDFPEF